MTNAAISRRIKTAGALVALFISGFAASQSQAQNYSGGYYGGGGYQGGYYGGGGYQGGYYGGGGYKGGYYGRGPTVNVNRTVRIQVPRYYDYYPSRYVQYGGRADFFPANYNGYRSGRYQRNGY